LNRAEKKENKKNKVAAEEAKQNREDAIERQPYYLKDKKY
jgi:hypothetical protein